VKRVVAVSESRRFDVILGPLVTCKDLLLRRQSMAKHNGQQYVDKGADTMSTDTADNRSVPWKESSKLGLQITLAQTVEVSGKWLTLWRRMISLNY